MVAKWNVGRADLVAKPVSVSEYDTPEYDALIAGSFEQLDYVATVTTQ